MVQRRIFIGPMPEKVIAQTEATQHKRTQLTIGSAFSLTQEQPDITRNADKIEQVSQFVKEHAFHFFLYEGGKAEDWDEEEKQRIIDKLAKRWKSSEWGQLWTRRHHHRKRGSQNTGGHHWLGTSFEVGTLMGVNVLQGKEHVMNLSGDPARDENSSNSLEALKSQPHASLSAAAPSTVQANGDAPISSVETSIDTPTTSQAALLPPGHSDTIPPKDEYILRPAMSTDVSGASAMSNGQLLVSNAKGKAKGVQCSDYAGPELLSLSPVPPEEPLQRTKSIVDTNGSLAPSIVLQGPTWGDVILRGVLF